MTPILRVLGLGLLESLAARLSPQTAVVVQFILILFGSLLPIVPMLTGAVHLADLLAYTVLAMALSVAGTLIRLRTMATQTETTQFFMLHYAAMIGILSLVCGVWAVILLVRAGPSGGWFALVPMAVALVLAQGWSLADGWFTRGGRHVAHVWQIVLPGYLRFAPLLVGTVFGASAYLGESSEGTRTAIAVGLVLAQAIIDVALAVAALRLRPRVAA
ncbi:hypothetical protein N802_06715 [Knoellia sinensis KCTC 19936]|uniref:Uncharacterized protein n=1 Tax=Knoellia sinensis KCTC 19936 TaxID=1385520 RepID=A0A0A0J319_9MICO|nr:DUF6498-containing protein [Knoellia sinensis]KGN30502.1 hypothetical protein N802_06715 [Knoellia sinensis KCTC 19936]